MIQPRHRKRPPKTSSLGVPQVLQRQEHSWLDAVVAASQSTKRNFSKPSCPYTCRGGRQLWVLRPLERGGRAGLGGEGTLFMLARNASVCSRGRLAQAMLIESLESVLHPRDCSPEAMLPEGTRIVNCEDQFYEAAPVEALVHTDRGVVKHLEICCKYSCFKAERMV